MKAEDLNPALDFLHRQLQDKLVEASEIKKTINGLLKQMGCEPEFTDVEAGQLTLRSVTRPDQYYGKPFATAAQEYLERRKQACSAEEIMKGLEQGGFDFKAAGWRPEDRLRSLAISLAKNNAKFHKLPNNTFGLLSWYPSVTGPERNGDSSE
jgi:hypothetical protein